MTYQVTIQPSGHSFTVAGEESVLDAALRQGIILPYGCRNGACGSCMGTVLAGQVSYAGKPPPALTADDAAADRALFCQARAGSDLAIAVREVDAARDIAVRDCR